MTKCCSITVQFVDPKISTYTPGRQFVFTPVFTRSDKCWDATVGRTYLWWDIFLPFCIQILRTNWVGVRVTTRSYRVKLFSTSATEWMTWHYVDRFLEIQLCCVQSHVIYITLSWNHLHAKLCTTERNEKIHSTEDNTRGYSRVT